MADQVEVLITPDALQQLIRAAYVAGAGAVHANFQPDPDPDFTEASYDYVAGLDFTESTRPGVSQAASELELLEEVCARYADDEDAYLGDEGEPFGSITTECGMKARSARRRFRAREAARAHVDA